MTQATYDEAVRTATPRARKGIRLCSWCDRQATFVLTPRTDKYWRDYACAEHTELYRDGFETIEPLGVSR